MPDPATVSNSSCLIALETIGRLGLLERLYGIVSIPPAVAQECRSTLPSWLRVHPVQNQAMIQTLRMNLGPGESKTIALAGELSVARLILDDKKARRVARQLGLPVTVLPAVVLPGKQCGFVRSVCDVIAELTAAHFHLFDLVEEALRQAGE